MSDTGLKKNYDIIGKTNTLEFDNGIAEAYEYIAKGVGSGMGRDILVARGLAEWFFSFSRMPPLDITSWSYIPPRSGAQETAEEMVVLFANMLQLQGGGL